MKYVIEIEDKKLCEYDKDTATYFPRLWKAKGFNALVFDQIGLDKLTPLDKELEEAYQRGLDEGYNNGYSQGLKDGCHKSDTEEYQQGLEDTWEAITKIAKMPDGERGKIFGDTWISNILNKYSVSEIIDKLKAYEKQQKADEIKASDVITDGKCNYLVIDITDKSYIALQGTDFEPVYIGKDYIKYYHNLHDSKDMRRIAEEINKAMKGEQHDCHTCKHQVASSIECVDCRNFGRWQPKEDAE